MKIWIADQRETLRTIAHLNRVRIEDLISLNRHIMNPDLNIAGKPVYFPAAFRGQEQITGTPPLCPPQTSGPMKQWIPLTPLEQMESNEYDVLIIGTGAGGGAVLWRLCEHWMNSDKRIAIIDRGDLVIPTHVRNLPTMNPSRLWDYYLNNSKELPGSYPDYLGAREVFALGGRTLFWDAVATRFQTSLLMEWPVPFRELESYYEIAERVLKVSDKFLEGAQFTEILLNRIEEGGFPEAVRLPMAADLKSSSYGEVNSDVITSSLSFLAKALNARPFDLAVQSRAVQIFFDDGKVTGVKVMSPDKRSFTLKAKTVVLSASTFETPRLLLHSNIQNGAIGHYLMNQSFLMARGMVDRKEFSEQLGTLGIYIPQTTERPYQVRLYGPDSFWYSVHQQRRLTEELAVDILTFGAIERRYENRITLQQDKKDEYGVPEVQVHFSFTEKDRDVMQQMMNEIRLLAVAAGIRPINGQNFFCQVPRGDLQHSSGTCQMGDDPSTSATNGYGLVHGLSNLYIADNSVIPSIGAGNPTLTTVALAIRTADHISRMH